MVRDPADYPLCYPALVPKDDEDFGTSGTECLNSFIRKNTDVDRGCSPRDGVANQVLSLGAFKEKLKLKSKI